MRLSTVLLITLCFFTTSIFAQPTESLFLKAAKQKLLHAKAYTLKVAATMPEEKYGFKPSAEEMDFGQQLLHLSANMGWLCSTYFGQTSNPITKEDGGLKKKEAIIAVLNKAYDFSLNILSHVTEKELSDTVSFFAGPMSKLQVINLLNDHQTHHRAQMLVYLRLNGIKPPDYVGW